MFRKQIPLDDFPIRHEISDEVSLLLNHAVNQALVTRREIEIGDIET